MIYLAALAIAAAALAIGTFVFFWLWGVAENLAGVIVDAFEDFGNE